MDKDELHDLVLLLQQSIASGELKIPEASGIRESLSRVRFGPDGIVDPISVDGQVRAAGLAAAAAQARRQMRKIALRDVQVQYFEILDLFFAKPYAEMKAHKLSPAQIAEHTASQANILNAFQAEAQEFASGMYKFWEDYGPVVDLHLAGLKALKSVFGGDIFPSYAANIACSVGLYMDTVVLPDPLLRILNLASVMEPKEALRLITKQPCRQWNTGTWLSQTSTLQSWSSQLIQCSGTGRIKLH